MYACAKILITRLELDHDPTEKDLKRLEKYREARNILLESSLRSSGSALMNVAVSSSILQKIRQDKNEIYRNYIQTSV